MDILEKYRKMNLLFSVLSILIGAVMAVFPEIVMNVICYAIGGLILIYGIVNVINYFMSSSASANLNYALVKGIILSVVGIIILINPQYIGSIIPVILGILFIIEGITYIQKAVFLKNHNVSKYIIGLINSVITLALGIFVLVNPFTTASAIVFILGIALIWYGVSSLWNFIYVQKKINKIKEAMIKNDIIDIK